jgi:hypothetical protein
MKKQSLIVLCAAFAMASNAAMANGKSFSNFCKQPNESLASQAIYKRSFWYASGQKTELYITDSAQNVSGCETQRLPFDAKTVEWINIISDDVASQLDSGIVLEGNLDKHQQFVPDTVSPLEETEKPKRKRRSQHSKVSTNSSSSSLTGQKLSAPPELHKPTPPTQFIVKHQDNGFIQSGWIWQPEAWQKNADTTLKKLKRWHMRQVFITVPVDEKTYTVETPDLLKTFLTNAHQQGIAVWAVDGDRYALLPEVRKDFLNRAKAYAAFNAAQSKEHIDGIQYDIEPYLVNGYGLDSASWNQAYLELLKSVKSETPLPIEIVLPFWFEQQKAGNDWFLDQVATLIDGLAIMDYRTDLEQIQAFAKPYLEWGIDYQKPVQIALETVDLPDNPTQIYHPALEGTVYLLKKNGLNLFVLLNAPIKAPLLGKSFALSHSNNNSSKQVTFYRQSDRLMDILKKLEPKFSAYSSFSGMAIHGIE